MFVFCVKTLEMLGEREKWGSHINISGTFYYMCCILDSLQPIFCNWIAGVDV